jgi:RNA polymerase sigma-B factor
MPPIATTIDPPAAPTRSAPTPAPAASSAPGQTDNTELFQRWCEHHDPRARDALIERFLPLARTLARRYIRTSEPYDDLVQVASLGLVNAVNRYDPSRGHAFTSFAVPTILGELRRHFRDTGWAVHVPRGLQERSRKINEAQQLLTNRSGRPPTVAQLSEYLELTHEEVLDGLHAGEAYDAVSLNATRPSDEDDGDSYLDSLGEEDHSLGLIDGAATIFAAAKELPERERQILFMRFGKDFTQTEIAEQIGVSQMQISRLLRKSLRRLHELTDEAPGEL